MLKFFYYEMNKKDLISKKKAIFNYIKLNNLFDNILYKEYMIPLQKGYYIFNFLQ